MKTSMPINKKLIRKGQIFIFWIVVWQVIYKLVGKDILVPSFYHIIQKVFELLGHPYFYYDVGMTFYRVLVGVTLSFCAGIFSACIAHRRPFIKDLLAPFIMTLKSTPVMAIIILALLWFTKNNVPIFVCFLMCYPVVYTNLLQGFQEVDQNLLEVAKVFKVKPRYVFKDIYLSQIAPYIQATLTMIVGLSWKVVIATEVLAVPKYSMGYHLLTSKSYLETETLFAWIIMIVGLSSLCERALTYFITKGRVQDDPN